MLHKYSPPLYLSDLYSQVKSVEGEQSAILAFNAGAQNAHVGRAKMKGLIEYMNDSRSYIRKMTCDILE